MAHAEAFIYDYCIESPSDYGSCWFNLEERTSLLLIACGSVRLMLVSARFKDGYGLLLVATLAIACLGGGSFSHI